MTDLTALQSSYMDHIRRKRIYSGILLALFIAVFVGGWQMANDRNAGGFLSGLPKVFEYPGELLAEAWSRIATMPGLIWDYMPALIETINIALVATIGGAVVGGLLALVSVRDFAPWPALVPLFRRVLDVMRAVPDVVIALVLIFILGGGPVPAMLAIAFHTAGALGKLFSEVAENADLKPVEGLESIGANWFQRMWLGVMPQVLPNWLSYGLLRVEVNIRASSILGFVGAGGIGYELKNAITWGPGRYTNAAAIFLMLFVTIIVVDQISSHYRHRLIHGDRK